MTAPELAPGAVIANRYQVAAVLGHGGSSNTYYARSQDGREVAAKLFDPAMRQRADIMQMVEQVYGLTNSMPANLVARVADAGYDPTTMAPFSVTERVPLPSLAQILSQRILTAEETIGMLKALARVMDAAHGAKLVHHALKPTNVFLGLAPAVSVRVTDFGAGLARLAVPTPEGYGLAAPWLAPEQVQQGVQAGPSADVFSAALVAFFALTGRSYWRSCQGATDLASWQRGIVGPRDAASTRAGQIGVQIDRAFDPVGCALGMDPNQRYRSIGELAAAMEGVAGGRANEARTVAFPQQSEYPPPPPPLAAAGGAPQPGYSAPVQAADPTRQPLGGPTLASARGDARAPQPAPRSASSKVAPIVVGLVALVLVGGGATALVLMGKKKTDDGPIAVATDSAAPAGASAAPSGSASAEPAASAAPATASAEPAPSAEASAAPSASADAAAGEAELTVTCDPACNEVVVDDKAMDDKDKPISLPPGKHKVTARKQGYYSLTESVYAAPGKKVEKAFHLTPNAKTAAGTATAAKPCGKFLKHCN